MKKSFKSSFAEISMRTENKEEKKDVNSGESGQGGTSTEDLSSLRFPRDDGRPIHQFNLCFISRKHCQFDKGRSPDL
jgi:hypothetical protein